MPLRDHFRPPLDDFTSWEGFHGGWPMVIVQQLRKILPDGYVAQPQVHLGAPFEIDIAAFEEDARPPTGEISETNGGVATAVWAPATANLTIETELPDYDEYEVRIYDAKRGRHLVAAIELVSPANKDRPEHRNAFVGKCAALIQKGVAVSPAEEQLLLKAAPPHLYATSCRWVKKEKRAILEAWSHVLTIGQPLPKLPLWLAADLVIPLDLEPSYEQACHDLWIT